MIRKLFSPKTLSSSSPFRFSVLVAQFTSTTSPNFHSHSSASSHSARARDEESKNVRVSVWWDFENCSIPASVNVFKVAHTITAAVRANGIKGPVQIMAFGDVFQLSRSNQLALSLTGVNINHIPRGGRDSADRSLLVDLMCWVSQNPPPAHLFLISGDRDFASILHRLRMYNYNILLACTDHAPSVLCGAASVMWQWNTLVKGENLNGKHFNQPPDGPNGSWYGHYRGPLENPFAVVEQPAQTEELSEENSEHNSPHSDPKIYPIPAAVLQQILHKLSLYPKGISITDLRYELFKRNVGIDKDFYGHKKFARFLLSMPHIVKLHKAGSGAYVVCGVNTKVPAAFEVNGCMSSAEVINNGEQKNTEPLNLNSKDLPFPRHKNKKSSLHPLAEVNMEQLLTKVQVPPSLVEKDVKMEGRKEVEQTPDTRGVPTDLFKAQVVETHMSPSKEQGSASGSGIFRTFWKKWLGDSDKKGEDSLENDGSSRDSPDREKIYKSFQKKHGQDDCLVHHASCLSTCTESAKESKSNKSLESSGEKSKRTPGLFTKIRNWFRFQSNPNSNALPDQPQAEFEQQNHGIFSEDSFWQDMEAFIASSGGSLIISQSRTR